MRNPTFRRAAVPAVAMTVLITLAACSSGGDGASSSGTTGASGGDCHLSFLASADRPTAEQDAYKEVFADFEKQFDCTVSTTFEGTWDQLPQQLSAARLAGTQVNLFLTSTATRDLAKAGLLMNLSTCIKPFEDRYLPSAVAPYTIDDKVWAVPMSSTDTSAIVYNADMFDELGLKPPTTFAELVQDGNVIAKAKGITPMIHQGKSPWYWPMWYMATFAQESGNKSVQYTEDFLSGKRKFTSPEEVKALADLAEFTKDGLLDRTTLDTDEQGMYAAFLQQKAAMFFALTPSLQNIRAAKPSFKIGVFQFPKVVDDAAVKPQVGGGPENGLSVASFAPADTQAMACQLIEFMSRPDEARKLLAPTDPLVPSIKGVAPTSTEPLADQLTKEFIPNTVQFLDWIWPSKVNDAVTSAITDVMYNNKSPQDAAASVQSALDKYKSEEDYQFDWWQGWKDADWQKVSFPSDMKIDVGN